MTRRPASRVIWEDVRDAARQATECGAPPSELRRLETRAWWLSDRRGPTGSYGAERADNRLSRLLAEVLDISARYCQCSTEALPAG